MEDALRAHRDYADFLTRNWEAFQQSVFVLLGMDDDVVSEAQDAAVRHGLPRGWFVGLDVVHRHDHLSTAGLCLRKD
jgi:hypothetical protein